MKGTKKRQRNKSRVTTHTIRKATLVSLFPMGSMHAGTKTVRFEHPITPKPLYERFEIESEDTQYLGIPHRVERIDKDMRSGVSGRIKTLYAWIHSDKAANVVGAWINSPDDLDECYPAGSRPIMMYGEFGPPVRFSS